jgi:acyl carrier protein
MEQSQVIEIVSQVAELPLDFNINANMRDELDIDSFRRAELAFALEAKLGRTLPDEAFAAAETVGDIVAIIKALKPL